MLQPPPPSRNLKINWIAFFASLFSVIFIGLLVLFFYSKIETPKYKPEHFKTVLLVILIFLWGANYFVLEFLFNYNSKKQIRKITKILPNNIIEVTDNDITLKELGERVSLMSTRNNVEMDLMLEMENFRKEYVGNVSHELKTPLFSIQGYIDILLNGGVEDLKIRDRYLGRIESSVERLINIVTDLDMINRFEAEQIELKYSTFDINELVEEVFELLDLEAKRFDMILELQSTQKVLMVTADKQKISQVFTNLVSNSIKYANREHATIIVSTSNAINGVYITVEDNGMGIKPENVARIFERFYRVETSRNRKDGGSGLGLAIVKHILEAHKQNITVESVYLSGTKFIFSLEKPIN